MRSRSGLHYVIERAARYPLIPTTRFSLFAGNCSFSYRRSHIFAVIILLFTDEGILCLESVEHPGHHVGVFSNGDVKPPASTDTGHDGQFIPILHPKSVSGAA